MQHFCILNKRIMEAKRKDALYATLLVDFVNLGVITKTEAETLLGYSIPSYLITTSGNEVTDGTDDDDDDKPVADTNN